VKHVSATSIFARGTHDGRQLLAYSGAVSPTAPTFRNTLLGPGSNVDWTIDARLVRASARLGALFRRCAAPYGGDPKTAEARDARAERATAAADVLRGILDAHRDTWALAPFDPGLPLGYAMASPSREERAPCRIALFFHLPPSEPDRAFSVELAFSSAPSHERYREISQAISAVLPA
jgi:hypothetical protein